MLCVELDKYLFPFAIKLFLKNVVKFLLLVSIHVTVNQCNVCVYIVWFVQSMSTYRTTFIVNNLIVFLFYFIVLEPLCTDIKIIIMYLHMMDNADWLRRNGSFELNHVVFNVHWRQLPNFAPIRRFFGRDFDLCVSKYNGYRYVSIWKFENLYQYINTIIGYYKIKSTLFQLGSEMAKRHIKLWMWNPCFN